MLYRQGQAHIVSTAIPLPRSCIAIVEVEATPWFRTWFSVDPQPASISPTINIIIVFIYAFLVDCGWIIRHSAIKNDSSAILRSGQRFVVRAADTELPEKERTHGHSPVSGVQARVAA